MWNMFQWRRSGVFIVNVQHKVAKLQSNFIEITLRHGCSPVNLLHILRTPFPKNTSGGLFLYLIHSLAFLIKPINKNLRTVYLRCSKWHARKWTGRNVYTYKRRNGRNVSRTLANIYDEDFLQEVTNNFRKKASS